ncbi:HsdM family class I SAM-dependent methyltransferase [Rubrobacter tropicus]|uniref:HsdM family class I SAM-dependent methyltransferase n=1 Tax=Rubrobacter tropicus TaxID=2653851 RepID=UPI00140E1F4E|nr:N-6 DNA methylase [Rubrobacter tropicus]
MGIADTFAIIENVAELLRLGDAYQPPRGMTQRQTQEVRQLLEGAADKVDGVGPLFDRHLLFRLSKILPGGRYPTPRHIVSMIFRIAEVEPSHRLCDLACGSGGFLVCRGITDGNVERTVGVEISPEWVRIARTNAYLHDVQARVEAGNALYVCGPKGELDGETFDRILLNPPFGEKLDAGLAKEVVGWNVGSRSETVFAALALSRLADGGRAAVLVPSGVLSGTGAGERELRRRLVEEHDVEAVVSLPKDAFQPFSSLQTHLLLVRKRTQSQDARTWFLQVESDGYPSGRGRDLTIDPPSFGDLPLIERVLTVRDEEVEESLPEDSPRLGIRWMSLGDGNVRGAVVQAVGANVISSAERFPAVGDEAAFVLLTVESMFGQGGDLFYVKVSLDGGTAEPLEEDPQQLIQRLYKPKSTDPNPGTSLFFKRADPVRAVAFTTGGRALGVAIPSSSTGPPQHELRPSRFVGGEEETHHAGSPTQLLSDIYKNQRLLVRHVDNLLGRLELRPIAGQEGPAPLLGDAVPFGRLSPGQEAVWRRVRDRFENLGDEGQEKAALFTLEEVDGVEPATVASDITRLTVGLLERMGIVMPVTVTDPSTGNSAAFYRLVTEKDLWLLPPKEDPLGEEGVSEQGNT